MHEGYRKVFWFKKISGIAQKCEEAAKNQHHLSTTDARLVLEILFASYVMCALYVDKITIMTTADTESFQWNIKFLKFCSATPF